jgi:hypothetical protein
MNRAEEYSLNNNLGRTRPLTPIGYDPTGPLDLDTRPIDGGDLRAWRKRLPSRRTGGLYDYPTLEEMSDDLGIAQPTLHGWESDGLTQPCWCALIREWGHERRSRDLPKRRATRGEVRALVKLLGSRRQLANAIDREVTTITQWTCRYPEESHKEPGAPRIGGGGPLIVWLFEDLELEPVGDLRGFVQRKLTRRDVREIRRRADDGESYKSICEDFPVAHATIRNVATREYYSDVR